MEKKQRSAEAQRQYEKWKATMERRMGKPIVEIMRENGRAGGKKGHAGKGYSAHPEMASEMGKLGAAKRWAKRGQIKSEVEYVDGGIISRGGGGLTLERKQHHAD